MPAPIVLAAILSRLIGRTSAAFPRGAVFCFEGGIQAAISRGMVPSARLSMTRNMANLRRATPPA